MAMTTIKLGNVMSSTPRFGSRFGGNFGNNLNI
jgi:hypothetical protein